MLRPIVLLVVLALATTPLALAAGPAGTAPTGDAPRLDDHVRGPGAVSVALDAAAGAASTAGSAIAGAATGTVEAVGAALGAIGSGIAWLAGAAFDGVVALFTFLGAALASLARLAATAVVAVASSVATLVGALFGALADAARTVGAALAWAATGLATLLGRGARAAVENPRETAIVAGSATGVGGLAWLVRRFGFLAGLPLYTRLAPGEMLDNGQRARVYEHIRAQPGATPTQLAEALGLGWGTITYHLARLEEGKLVTSKSYHHRKCYFAIGSDLDAAGRTAVAAMASDPARRIVEAVAAAPGITQKDVAARLDMSQALVSWHVKRLVGAGVLLTMKDGRSNTLRVAAHVPLAGAAPALA